MARLRETARGQIQGVQKGLLKLLFGLKDHNLPGTHIVGAVFNYPTFAEACKIAALDAWNRVRA